LHGAWCFDRLIPELAKLGHQAVAMDLPGHGKLRHERSTLAGYQQAVVDVLRPGDVVVGHSLGCGAATLAVDAFPDVSHIVYLAGPLPLEGEPIFTAFLGSVAADGTLQMSGGGAASFLEGPDDDGRVTLSNENARQCFYHDCPPEIADWAVSRLVPQSVAVLAIETMSAPGFWKLNPPRSFIRCDDDHAFPAEAADLQEQRLGVEALHMSTSHSPFLSRPAELAALLGAATRTQPHRALQPGVVEGHGR
jgi:pimeloyl-ACP methyl ester carboxylesterase